VSKYNLTDDDFEVLDRCGFNDYDIDFSFIDSTLVLAILATCRKWLAEKDTEHE
jgi:hypothetical protein